MTSRWARRLALLVACFVFVGMLPEPDAGARSSRRRKRKHRKKRRHHRKAKRHSARAAKKPPGYYEAKKLFGEAVRLFDDGDYPGAVKKFKAALRRYKNPRIHARIALCYKWIGDKLEALRHYELFLREFPAEPEREKDRRLRGRVQREVQALLRLIARIRLIVPGPPGAEVRLNGAVVGRAPLDRKVRLGPGSGNVTVIARGYYAFRRDLTLAANDSVVLRVKLLKIKPKVIKVVVPATPVYKRWWFWTALGAVLAGGATALAVTLGSTEKSRMPSGTELRHDTLRFTW